MLRVSSPAMIAESLPVIARARRMKPWMRRAAVFQILQSDTVAFHDQAGRLVAVAGFFPLPAEGKFEVSEVWFACMPAMGRDLLSFVKLARLTCARMAEHGSVKLRALVREGHRPGARLAVLCGFALVEAAHGFEVWEWSGGDGKISDEAGDAEPYVDAQGSGGGE